MISCMVILVLNTSYLQMYTGTVSYDPSAPIFINKIVTSRRQAATF